MWIWWKNCAKGRIRPVRFMAGPICRSDSGKPCMATLSGMRRRAPRSARQGNDAVRSVETGTSAEAYDRLHGADVMSTVFGTSVFGYAEKREDGAACPAYMFLYRKRSKPAALPPMDGLKRKLPNGTCLGPAEEMTSETGPHMAGAAAKFLIYAWFSRLWVCAR